MRTCFYTVYLGAVLACSPPPPQLDAIAPEQGPSDQEVEVVIKGALFAQGVQAQLVGPAFSYSIRVDQEGGQRLEGRVPSGVEPGSYDLHVTNPDGATDRLPAAYRSSLARLSIYTLDVGQGASMLVVGTDGTTLLIDGGKQGRADTVLRPALQRLANGRLDTVVVTHFDVDHLAGVVELLSGPDNTAGTDDDLKPIGGVWDYGDDGSCTTQVCERYRLASQSQTIVPGQQFRLGEAVARCVAVNGVLDSGDTIAIDDDSNQASVALLLQYGGASLLVSGDLTGGGLGSVDVETPLAAAVGHVDVWHLNHHGSASSTAVSALAHHTPRLALISVDTDGAYCHPAQQVLDRLESAGVPTFLTGAGVVNSSTNCPERTRLGNTMQVVGEIAVEFNAVGGVSVNGQSY